MAGKVQFWNDAMVKKALEACASASSAVEARDRFVAATGATHVTVPAFRNALSGRGHVISALLAKRRPVADRKGEAEEAGAVGRFADLVALAKKHRNRGGLTLEVLCDSLDLSPRAGRDLLADAQAAGFSLEVHDEEVAFKAPEPSQKEQDAGGTVPPLGAWNTVGVISDLHVASKHHEPEALAEHIRYCVEDCGVKDFMVPGDIVAGGGRYHFLRFEVTRTGIEDQCAEALKTFPQYPGVRYHMIAGNHDESFDVGIDAARQMVRIATEEGRGDLLYYGARGAMLRLGGLRWELWHPGGSLGYSHDYRTKRHVDATAPEDRPDILLVGHFHQAMYFQRGGVHAFLCGTFESGASSFGKMIGGDVALGGWIIRYAVAANGKLGAIVPEFRSYRHSKMTYAETGR